MKKLTHINLFSYVKKLSFTVIFLSIAVTAMDVGIRRSIGNLITALSNNQIYHFNWSIPGCMAVLFVLLKFLLPYVKTCFANRLQEVLYIALENKALYAGQSALDGIDPGMASTYFTSDIADIIRYANRVIGNLIPDVFTFLFSVTILSIMNPWLGLAAVLSSIFPVVSMLFMSRILVRGSINY